MSNKREMLEYAANACGITKDDSAYNGGGSNNTGFDIMGNLVTYWHNGESWNPLTNSADCAAMCAKLDINTFYYLSIPKVECSAEDAGDEQVISHIHGHNRTNAGKEAAWRYAATMVAAQIGGMK